MNKTELINAVAESANLTKKQAEAAVNAFTASVAESLKKGEDVQIIGFGSFKVRERGERIGRNIKTGEKISRPDRVVIDGQNVTVIDYKFGQLEQDNYAEKVSKYMQLVRDMGYTHVEGYLWYVEKDKFVEVE